MEGYAKLARLFSHFPEIICFRKFSQLNLELLLYKQAEISHVELKIKNLRKSEPVGCARSWHKTQEAGVDDTAGQKRELFGELDGLMCAYHEHLLRLAQISKLLPPSNLCVQNLSDWLADPKIHGDKGCLEGFEGKQWRNDRINELVSTSPQPDKLDRLCMSMFAPLWHAINGRCRQPNVDVEKGGGGTLWWYAPKHFVRIADVFCVFMSAAIPSLSTVALFFVDSMKYRFIMISLFTLVFAAVILLGFGCGRANTFGATVAFAAVQVVFVQSVSTIQSP